MTNSSKRVSRPRASALPATGHTRDTRPLLARILDTPHLTQVVRRLQPEVLHRIIDRVGLEDSGELVALASPAQLTGLFDLDLWHRDKPGVDERFDADRFGVWLDVLAESGADVAARTLAGVDAGLVTTAFAEYITVFDPATVRNPGATDEDDVFEEAPTNAMTADIGGYLVVSKRADAWDAVVAVLLALDAQHHRAFHTIMRGCRSLSNSAPELDGLDDLLTEPEQVMFNLALDRDRRREREGYATPAEARAFLEMARHLPVGKTSTPPKNPIAAAYFRTADETMEASTQEVAGQLEAPDAMPVTDEGSAGGSLVDILIDEGVVPRPPRALLGGPQGAAPRLARIQAQLQFIHDADPAAYLTRTQELAFLANVMLSGCSIQGRALTLQEASDAAVAVCNLGLENWPRHWPTAPSLPDAFLASHDLVVVFQVGWHVLYDQVCMFTAERLIKVLKSLKCEDRETRAGLTALRKEMTAAWKDGTPWRARDALDVITSLDMPAWAVLLGLTAECPAIHAGLGSAGAHTVSASSFEFISDQSQIALVHTFMDALPETLRG